MNIPDSATIFTQFGIEVHGCARGKSGTCHLVGSKRGNWDHGDKECRTFFGASLRDPQAEWIKFRFSVSRSALATERIQRLTQDPEVFLLQAGLARFRKFLAADDTPGRADEFMLHSRSASEEFVMVDDAELQCEVARVRREVLEALWTHRHSGGKRMNLHELKAQVCALDTILNPTLGTLESRKLITGAHGVSGIKMLPDGEVELDRLRTIAPATSAQPSIVPEKTDYDVFVSHASEDKEAFVRPLAHALKAAGVKVWYDETELGWGMSLRATIDKGLSNSRFGLVVLSHAFFAKEKEWTQRELSGLFAMLRGDRPRILPIWHGLSADDVAKYSPMTADLLAIKSSEGIDAIVKKVLDATHK